MPKNKLIEKVLSIYLDQLNRAKYIKSYKQMADDKSITQLAEEGMADYLSQFSDRFGLRMLAGYQFQEANKFKSKDYFSELSATVNERKTDFFNHEIVSTYEPVLGMSTRNQYLYFQVGIVHVFDRRSFLNNSYAKGDPIIW